MTHTRFPASPRESGPELSRPAASHSYFVPAGPVNLHYLDYGTDGHPPMLCVHGGAAHAHWFDFVASGFTPDYHVRALDLRGHGDSDWSEPPDYSFDDYAADIASVADKLDLKDFVLIGHSMGGMVALIYAATYPGRLGKLVVVDTTMHMSKSTVGRLRDFGARPSRNYGTREELVDRYRLQPVNTMATAPEVVRHLAERSGRHPPDGAWQHKFDRRLYSIFERRDGIPYWEKIRVPALLIRGDHSERVTKRTFDDVRARAPHVRFGEVAQSDHHIMLDNPGGFVQVVREFLDD